MSQEIAERRVFLQQLSFLGGSVLLWGPGCNAGGVPVPPPPKLGPMALHPSTSHLTFTEVDYAVMSAAVDRILPRDQDPGALDAGVPFYVDRVLQTAELHQMRLDFLDGLTALQKRARGTYSKSFPELAAAEQDLLLTDFKNAPIGSGEAQFYENLLTLTMEGFLGAPEYGGNRDRVGWTLVGFDTWLPPDYQPEEGTLVQLGRSAP